jgi:integrase
MKFPKIIKNGSAIARIYETPTRINNKDYIQYTLTYYLNGQRERRKFSNLEKAIDEGKMAVAKISSGDLEVLTISSEDRASYVKALEIIVAAQKPLVAVATEYMEALKLLPKGTGLVEACREFARRHSEVREEHTIPKLLELYLASQKKGNRSLRYLQTLKSRLARFANAFQCKPKSIQREHIEHFLDNLGVANRTRKNEIDIIKSFFNWAIRLKYAPKDIAEEILSVQRPKIETQDITFWKPDEMHELLSYSPQEYIPYIVIGGFLGLRPSEIIRADWSHFTDCYNYFEVRAKKGTASRRVIPVPKCAKEWLSSYWKENGPIAPLSRETRIVKKILQSVNKNRIQNKQQPLKWQRNALRHSFGSYRLAVTQNINQVSLEMGNTPDVIRKHYYQVVTPEQGQAFFSISPNDPAL